MPSESAVQQRLRRVQAGDDEAVREIWERFFPRMLSVARKRLRETPQRDGDEEDVAVSAFASFYRGAREGRFPDVADSEELWKLIATITARKAYRRIRAQLTQRRGRGNTRGESVFVSERDDKQVGGLSHAAIDELEPHLVVSASESVRGMLETLQDEVLQQIALMKMEGFTNAEIAEQRNMSERTVKRKISAIRQLWESAESSDREAAL